MATPFRSAESYSAQARAEQAKEIDRLGLPGEAADKALYKQWEKLKKEADKRRSPWIGQWQEVYSYTLPLREGFFTEAPGQDHSDLIYDETAVTAIPKLASRLAAGYFPEFGEIFTLSYGPDAPSHLHNADGEAKLLELTRMIHESWQNSNMGIEVGEAMIDLAIGTCNLLIEPGYWPGDTLFTSVDATGLALLPSYNGGVGGRFWWRKIALEDVKSSYPKATFSKQIERDFVKDPRKEVKIECGYWPMAGSPANERYQFVVLLPEYGETGVVYSRVDEGEGSCAWAGARWSKTGRDVWGRGPVILTMPAIKTANLAIQMTFENAEFAIGGMWTYDDDGVFDPDSVTFQPGTFIPKSREGKVEPLQSGAQFNVSDIVLADQRKNIKAGLMVDEYDAPGDTPFSAFEVQQRRADTARDMTAPGSRITHELIVKAVNRTIWIFEKQGILDAIGLRVDGKRLKLTPKSPFLRGQDAIVMQELMTGAGQINAIFGAGTSGMVFGLEQTSTEILQRNGIPLRLKNSPADIQAMGAKAGGAAAQAMGPGGPAQGADPMAVLAPIMDAAKR